MTCLEWGSEDLSPTLIWVVRGATIPGDADVHVYVVIAEDEEEALRWFYLKGHRLLTHAPKCAGSPESILGGPFESGAELSEFFRTKFL